MNAPVDLRALDNGQSEIYADAQDRGLHPPVCDALHTALCQPIAFTMRAMLGPTYSRGLLIVVCAEEARMRVEYVLANEVAKHPTHCHVRRKVL